jgi:hypothetical protein
MEEVLREPVELTQAELDVVAGGWSLDVDIGNHVHQFNNSLNLVSVGNNNNGVSGNQVVFG